MAQILFASNNPTHWGPVAGEGNSNFDATRVPYSIQWSGGEISSPPFKTHAGTVTWLRVYFVGAAQGSGIGTSEENVFRVQDTLGRTLLLLRSYSGNTNGYYTFFNADGASNNSGSIGSVNTPRWIDIQFEITPFLISFTIYHNGVLVASYTYNSNPAGVTNIGFFIGANPFGTARMSEFIVSDGDTRLARLNMVRPQGIGHYTDWLGDVATLADNNLNTGMTTTSINQRSSVIMQPYTNNEIISNVVVASQHLRGQNSPSKIRHFLRASGIDYDDAATFDVDFGATVTQSDYAINPATSLPWDLASVGAAEFGFKSET